MKELIKINYNNEQILVDGRELYEALKINSNYTTWFNRMREYGFIENIDYIICFPNLESKIRGGQNKINHQLTINMAKELCMIQRNEIGKKFRLYFIDIENKWNTPEAIMARALQIANHQIENLKNVNKILQLENKTQQLKITDDEPKVSYYDLILQNKSLITITQIAKDYDYSATKFNKLLYDLSIQYKQSNQWLLYHQYQNKGYTQSSTYIDSSNWSHLSTKWTQRGRIFLYEILMKHNILPIIEKEIY